MKKAVKIIIGIFAGLLVLAILTCIYVALVWAGAFNKLMPETIAEYESPDGKYTLVYQQLGSPYWPFGPVEIRLKLYNENDKKLYSVDDMVYNDGCSATEYNIASIEWGEDSVSVVLQACEMEDKTVELPYKNKRR